MIVAWADVFVQPELGWILVLAYLYYEVRFGRVSKYLNVMDDKLNSIMVVVRALVRSNPRVDTERADEILYVQDIDPGDLIREVSADGGEEEDKDGG